MRGQQFPARLGTLQRACRLAGAASFTALLSSALAALFGLAVVPAPPARAGAGVHTTYLWHMHQPVYWPAESAWTPGRYETAYETITLGHSQNDEFAIFNSDDRVGDYQWYPKDAVQALLDLPEAGAQVSFAGALMENLFSLGDNHWNGGRYAVDWYSHYRTARGWTNSAGRPRLEPVLVAFHHPIAPLMDAEAFAMELAIHKALYPDAWGAGPLSAGYFPAEMCFSERLIPALAAAGVAWAVVPDLHLARACANYPAQADLDNCDPPNRADQVNPAQANWTSHTISRGVTLRVPYPYAFTPHRAEHVDPATGAVSQIVVVPAANAMSWEEGYGTFGTGGIDAVAGANDPGRPMLILFAHDGDNAWSGGWSYYHESVGSFSHQAAAAGYTPTTVATYLQHHPVPADDVVHVEDGGWVNADGDFGSPQFINWNWPLVDQAGAFDIPGGWAEDERNWAVLTAAQNRVATAAAALGAVDPARVADPLGGANAAEAAWHFLLAGYESGYMYNGTSLDMEVKATLACNAAVARADPVVAAGGDAVPPTIWLPQRLPWNPGGYGGGSLWGYPGGQGAPMPRTFHVWTFVHDVSGLARVELLLRRDRDGANDPATHDNETYAGGAGVEAWQSLPMNRRAMPKGEPWEMASVDFPVLPTHIADEYWAEVAGFRDVLLDYCVEAEDSLGHVARSPIQHVYVGEGGGGAGFVMDGRLDGGAALVAAGDGLSLWARVDGATLYVASEGIGATPGQDRFLLIAADTGAARTAPWAKAGQCVAWDWFLAAEADNGWSGWFDAAEQVRTGAGLAKAHGAVLEGTIDLAALFPGGPPPTLWLAAAAYATPNGGALARQAPAGDGDGGLEAAEMVSLSTLTAAPDPGRAPGRPGPRLRLSPNPFNAALVCEVDYAAAGAGAVAARGVPATVAISIHDAAGRRVRALSVPLVAGRATVRWDGRDDAGRPAPSGAYVVRARAGDGGGGREIVGRALLVK